MKRRLVLKRTVLGCVSALALLGAALSPARAADMASCPALLDREAYVKIKQEPYVFLVPGGEGWVFRTQNDMQTDFSPPPQAMTWYKDLVAALKAQGTDLVMFLLPTRGMAAEAFVPSKLPQGVTFNPKLMREEYAKIIADFQKLGIVATGYDPAQIKPEYFQKTDHHWSVAGARAAAERVAAAVAQLPSYAALDKQPFETRDQGTYTYDPSFNRVVEDLCGIKLPLLTDHKVTTLPKDAAQKASDLFDNAKEPQIALVGTSNSKANALTPNFDGALKELLSADVYNAAVTGGGMDDSILSYMTSGTFARQKPKIIIWEIPVYYLDSDFKEMFQQLLPAIAGDCGEQAVLKSGPTDLTGKDIRIMSNITSAQFSPGEKVNLVLDFSKAPKKHFMLSARNATGVEVQKFKFKRSKRYPEDGRFYFTLDPQKIATIDTLAILPPDELQGFKVQARLCRSR